MAFKTYLISVVGVLIIQWSVNPLIAAGTDGRTSVTPPTLVVQSGHNFAIQSIVFSPDGRWLATAGWDGNVKVWDASAGLEVGTLTGHSGAVSAVAFSPDNHLLASANANHTVTVWNFDTGKQKVEMHGHTEVVDSVAFTSDGQWLISGSQLESQIRIWSIPSGTESHSVKGRSFVASPDATLLAVESAEGFIEVYEVGTWRTTAHLMTKGRPVSFSPNGHELAIAEKDSVHVWNIQNAVEIAKIGRFDPDPNQSTLAVAFDESWQLMASGGTDNAVTLWDVKNNRQLWKNEGYNGPVAGVPVHVVSSLSFHPKQKLLVSGNWDNTVAYLDPVTGRTVRLIKHHTERLGDVVVSPDGHWLAYPGENDQATLWDLAS